jgi:hypothetical protein
MNRLIFILYGIILLSLLACAGPLTRINTDMLERDKQAEVFYIELEKVIKKYDVSDASSFPVDGFPYLRTNRFLAGIKDYPDFIQSGNHWAQQLLNLGKASQFKEIGNLPEPAIQELSQVIGESLDRQMIRQKAGAYAQQLFASDQSHPDFINMLKKAVWVPDEYSTLARWIGFYPLAGIPVTAGTAVAYSRYEKWHQAEEAELDLLGTLIQYMPQLETESVDPNFIKQLYDSSNLDAFGLPKVTSQDIRKLAFRFAPIIRQDVAEAYDRIGRIEWRNNQVRVDISQPRIYYYPSHSFLAGLPVLQLNYAFWYPERAGKNAPWIEHGPLDGVTYRVTLDPAGDAVMVDIMNSCGCYFFFVPKKEAIAKVVTKPGEIAPLIPTWMPSEFPQKRLQLRINSGWHQVQHIGTEDFSRDTQMYELVPYEELESLPRKNGQTESVFTSAGIMKDSWRIEPYIFFSMGIADIGYMRQRGHHAIKMVGRGHFTDPHLFDVSFQFH